MSSPIVLVVPPRTDPAPPPPAPVNSTPFPERIWLSALRYLSAAQLVRFSAVSRYCHQLACNDQLWKDIYQREIPHENQVASPSCWRVAYQKAIAIWRNWKNANFKLQYIKTGGTSHFCLHGDRLFYRTGSSIQCSNIRTGALVWRADISLDTLNFMQVDRATERVVCVSKTSNVIVYDSNGTIYHSMRPDGEIVQCELRNNLLFLLLKFKPTKQFRLDVWDLQSRTLLRSLPVAYRSRFCLAPNLLIISETTAIRALTLPHLLPALNVPTEPVRSHKAMATNGRLIFRVLKLASDSFEIQVMDTVQKTLVWRLSASSPIRALLADAWRLIVAFQDYVRVWDLTSHALLLHLPKDVMKERLDIQLASVKLVEVKVPWTSVFSVPCMAFQHSRLLVKFPSEQHIVMCHFASSKALLDGSPMPPLRLSGTTAADEETDAVSESTAVTMYGDRLGQAGPMTVNDTALNLDEFA